MQFQSLTNLDTQEMDTQTVTFLLAAYIPYRNILSMPQCNGHELPSIPQSTHSSNHLLKESTYQGKLFYIVPKGQSSPKTENALLSMKYTQKATSSILRPKLRQGIKTAGPERGWVKFLPTYIHSSLQWRLGKMYCSLLQHQLPKDCNLEQPNMPFPNFNWHEAFLTSDRYFRIMEMPLSLTLKLSLGRQCA